MQVELLLSRPCGVVVGKLQEMGIWHREPFFSKMLQSGAAEGKGRGIKSLHMVPGFYEDSVPRVWWDWNQRQRWGLPAFLV